MSLSPTSTPAEIAAHLRSLGGTFAPLADELDPPAPITVTLPRAAVAAFVGLRDLGGDQGGGIYGVLRRALREALEAPPRGALLGLIDRDEDPWLVEANGTFDGGRSREHVASMWGPVREVYVGDPDASRFIAN